MSYCLCIFRVFLERGGWVVQRWSYIWDFLFSRVQIGGWSGLDWRFQGYLGNLVLKFFSQDIFYWLVFF